MKFKRVGTQNTRKGPKGTYVSEDGRFRIDWEERQGARSGWRVRDVTERLRSTRADNLAEAKEAAREMLIDAMTAIVCSPDWGDR